VAGLAPAMLFWYGEFLLGEIKGRLTGREPLAHSGKRLSSC
jgi:hypothetical protein